MSPGQRVPGREGSVTREPVVATRRPAGNPRIDVLPPRDQPAGAFEPREDRVHRAARQPGGLTDVVAVALLLRVLEEDAQDDLRGDRHPRGHRRTLPRT